MKEEKVMLNVEIENLDKANELLDSYYNKLKEAQTLANELASMEFEIKVNS